MYKIIGRLSNPLYTHEGEPVEISKTLYARFKWTMFLKTLYLQLFFDWIEIEVDDISKFLPPRN